MPSTLIFPDGVRLASHEELPGPDGERASLWARIEAANIAAGFVLTRADGERFKFYAEANVDAPFIQSAFRDLCHALLESEATLLFGEIDDEPHSLGSADISVVLDVLRRNQYQLAHDGRVHFGVVNDNDAVNEVFVAPTKHLKVWLNNETRFRSAMEKHGVPEASHLEFLDQYPRMTTLPTEKGALREISELASRLQSEITAQGRPN